MPRGPARPWKAVAPHTQRAFPYINAAMAQGYDIELKITGVEDSEMMDLRRGLFNAAKLSGVSVHVDKARQGDGTWTLTYAIHDKNKARAYHLQKNGTDRQKWPYNPRRPSPRDEYGNRTDA